MLKKTLMFIGACCLTVTAWATPDSEQIISSNGEEKKSIYLLIDSIEASEKSPDWVNAVIVTDTINTVIKQSGVTVNCKDGNIKKNWHQTSDEQGLFDKSQTVEDTSPFELPKAGSVDDGLVKRLCEKQ